MKQKVRIPFRAYPEDLPRLVAIAKHEQDPVECECRKLREEVDALKAQNYQLVEEVEYLKGVAGVSAKG